MKNYEIISKIIKKKNIYLIYSYKYSKFLCLKIIKNHVENIKIENGVDIYEIYKYKNKNYIFLELMGVNLENLIYKYNYIFSLNDLYHIINNIIIFLKILKKKNFIYGDLKPENIMTQINQNELACYCIKNIKKRKKILNDFKFSPNMNSIKIIDIDSINDLNNNIISYTKYYAAPELNDKYTYKFDIWSLGCIILELINKKTFFPLNNKKYIKSRNDDYISNKILIIKEKYNDYIDYINLAEKMLIIDPLKRIDLDEIEIYLKNLRY